MVEGFPTEVSAFLILFARIGAVLMLLPAFSDEALPAHVRLFLALGLTAGLWGILGGRTMAVIRTEYTLPALVITEMLVGLAIGAMIKIMFQAVAMAGSIISIQIGLSSVLVADPSQGGQASLLSRFMAVAATLVCLSAGLHHLWFAAMIGSYDVLPIGGLPPAGDFLQLAVDVVGRSMSLALGLAAPLIVYGVVFNVALGLGARVAPAIQIFFIAQPLSLILGVALTATLFGAFLTAFSQAMADWMQSGWS